MLPPLSPLNKIASFGQIVHLGEVVVWLHVLFCRGTIFAFSLRLPTEHFMWLGSASFVGVRSPSRLMIGLRGNLSRPRLVYRLLPRGIHAGVSVLGRLSRIHLSRQVL
uniref:(northern house mosquito) hypothetical protein n=1 Tax=Culex pipiens TaxID=7175 RepID=A0A8D8ATQ0_CULPI